MQTLIKNRNSLFLSVLLALCQNSNAQKIPGAGSQLQQLPTTQAPQSTLPDIRIRGASAAAIPSTESVRVLIRVIHVSGNHVFRENSLLSAAGFVPDSILSLSDLQAMATRISEFYRSHGFFVGRAFLKAQKITDNEVTISVQEGRYGKVKLRNTSKLSNRYAQSKLDGLDSGDPITIDPLENHLLLLSDTPGINVSSTLVPGELPGASDLLVDVTPAERTTGSVDADNAGNPYTGEYRIGATVNLNDPLGLGDLASLRVLTSGHGLRYGRAAYQMPVSMATVGVAYSRLGYALGKQFSTLGANGSADVASISAYQPVIRSRDTNLFVGLVYENKTFHDKIELFHSVSDRTAHVLTAQLYGSHQDDFGGGGVTNFFTGLSLGSLDVESPAARAADAASARTDGSYGKLWFNAGRMQRITDMVSLYARFAGQLSSKNLDPSEKFVLGGIDGTRDYPQGEGFGDEGYLASLEVRLLLAKLASHERGQVHLLGFVDTGHVMINQHAWSAGSNSRTLNSAGLGATWDDPGKFSVRTYYARKLGDEEAVSAPDKSGRFWIQVIKFF